LRSLRDRVVWPVGWIGFVAFADQGSAAIPSGVEAVKRMGRRLLYTMGEIAALVGLSRQTLHAYARRGLIVPAAVTSGGHRLFSGKVVRRLDVVRALAADRSLTEVEALLRVGTGGRRR
jgi:predicted transcriptional regulator